MAQTNTLELLNYARANGVAIPAFNIDNLESAMAVAEVIKERRLPIIIQMIPRTLAYGSVAVYPAMINALLRGCDVPYAIHLDHGGSVSIANECIAESFSSVMIDGSALPLEENIALTAEVRQLAHAKGIAVEGELGTIGGKEEGDVDLSAQYTTVSEAKIYVEKSGVDSLAVAVGTAHGIYKGTPVICVDRIKEISAVIPNTPLVLHGASGLSNEVLKECIKAGICKINFATELRQAYTTSIRTSLAEDSQIFDPKPYMRKAVDNIKRTLNAKIDVCFENAQL